MTRSERGEAARRAYDEIRRGIIAGQIRPGSMLSEAQLATGLAMSRTPVRSALGRLQEEGWIRIYPQRGALVRELTPTEIRESAQARHALETAGVRRSTPAQLDALRKEAEACLREQDAALDDGEFHCFNLSSQRFHRLFVELAGNTTMLSLYDRVQERQLLAVAGNADVIAQHRVVIMAEHRRLLEEAWRRDWVAFAAVLDAHQAHHPNPPSE